MQCETLALLYKTAGDTLRLDILRVLEKDSFGVQELSDLFDMPQPGMSHHLKLLSSAGLLKPRRQGNKIFYRRSLLSKEELFFEVKKNLFTTLDETKLSEDLNKKLDAIYEERSKESRSFFAKNAKVFQEKQGRLVELEQYLSNMKELLDLAKFPVNATALEIGPGHGNFLYDLAGRFKQIVALDNSKEMLALAKESFLCDQAASDKRNLTKIEFVHGSLESFTPKKIFDAVILNMVLHHLPSPPSIFKKLRKLVSPGGFVMVADLGPHDQDWVRESCGDLWLGFDPEELDQWGRESEFFCVESIYLGLKNGFQIQLKLFQLT